MASGGYPGSYEKGKLISGLGACGPDDVVVFHAGNEVRSDAGGRQVRCLRGRLRHEDRVPS